MMDSKHPEIALGTDFGTGFTAVTRRTGAKVTHMQFPGVGPQLPTAVLWSSDGRHLIGGAALNAAFKNPAALYTHFKRGIAALPDQPWNGGPTPVELATAVLAHVWDVILKTNPDVRNYVPELGGSRPTDLLQIILTHPATYTIDQQKSLQKAAENVGNGFRINGLIAEPIAGSLVFREQHGQALQQGDLVAVIDVGAGTTDCCIAKIQLSTLDSTMLFLETSEGLEELELTRDAFIELCAAPPSLWDQFDTAVAGTIEGSPTPGQTTSGT